MDFALLKETTTMTVCSLTQLFAISRSQINRQLKANDEVRRSLDAKGEFIAHIEVIKQRAFQNGIAFIEGHVFSINKDIVSAMVKCIHESKCGRTRQSFEDMFRCNDLGKSFKNLEKSEDIVIIKLGRKILYISKERKEIQIRAYYRKKGKLLREKEKETITLALIFCTIKYDNLSKIEANVRKDLSRGGRKPFTFKAMLNSILCMVIKSWKYYTTISKELDNDLDLAVALGFEPNKKTPSPSCLSRFVQQVGNHVGRNIDEELEQLLIQKREINKNKEKVKTANNNIKRVKSHERNFIQLDELDNEIKVLNKRIQEIEDEISKNGWYEVFTYLVSQLLLLQIIDGKIVCLDATHINAGRKDPNQSYGVKRAEKQADGTMKITKDFFGYKIHISVDAKTNLPIAVTVTTGCVADNKECPKIIHQLKRHGICFNVFLADGGYNDKKIYAEIYKHNKESRFICPLPKNEDGTEPDTQYYYDPNNRERYEIHYNTEEGRTLFKMRGPTENINKIIKCDLNMDKPKVRGIRAIESMAYIYCIAVLILAIATKITGREHLINQFSKVV